MENVDNAPSLFPHLPKRLSGLEELAENLWWSWNPGARMLFKTLDRQAWKESGHNPDKMLRELPPEILERACADVDYLRRYDDVLAVFHSYMQQKECSLLRSVTRDHKRAVAYFSAEYGLHRSLPFYAGGLGFLAGDFIKECSDVCLPLVAVGFMYPEGYLRQQIREDGWQENLVEPINREAAPISRVMDKEHRQLVVRVPLTDPPIHVAVWKVAVGRVSLYLMDTDVEANDPWNRGITARLYIGDLEQRLRQEIVLGLGGAEVLRTLGIEHYLLHLNEGHAAFALLERIREAVSAGKDFKVALWQTHHWLKVKLIDAIRERTRRRWADGNASPSILLTGGAFLEPSVLTLGFARRFATYKRALLIFQDLERLRKHLKDRWRPIQIIFAGKAHPADDPGKRLLQNLINLARDPQLVGRIAFVENYGEQLAQYLVHGVDVWLNNPLPPFEACGTSGMKAALNGVPQLSILDGWWEEGFDGGNGWAVAHEESDDDPDRGDAERIYGILEDNVIPLYYGMSENGVPRGWVKLMKASMKSAAAGFSARRMVREYVVKFYTKRLEGVLKS